MRPWQSNTPAERSPASRTGVLNAVRSMVCACSSTTEIKRFHMIWLCIWASAVLGRSTMDSSFATGELNIAKTVDAHIELRADDGRGVVFRDHRWSPDGRAGCQIGPPINRYIPKFG